MSEVQVEELKRLYESSNLKLKDLAALFDVSIGTICNYIRRMEKGGAK